MANLWPLVLLGLVVRLRGITMSERIEMEVVIDTEIQQLYYIDQILHFNNKVSELRRQYPSIYRWSIGINEFGELSFIGWRREGEGEGG